MPTLLPLVDLVDSDRPNPETLATQVHTWRTRLFVHLMAEERERLHDRLEASLPYARTEVDALRSQHAELIRALEAIRVRLTQGTSVDFGFVRDRLEEATRLWAVHETTEDQLIDEAARQADDGRGAEPLLDR